MTKRPNEHFNATRAIKRDQHGAPFTNRGCLKWRHWYHDDVIKWKKIPRYWSFVRGIHRSPVNSPNKGPWRDALMFSFIYARINSWINNRENGDLRRYHAHHDVIVIVITNRMCWMLSVMVKQSAWQPSDNDECNKFRGWSVIWVNNLMYGINVWNWLINKYYCVFAFNRQQNKTNFVLDIPFHDCFQGKWWKT